MARVASLLCETLGTFTSAFALSLPYQLSPLGFSFVMSLNPALLLGLPVFTCGPVVGVLRLGGSTSPVGYCQPDHSGRPDGVWGFLLPHWR